MKRGVEVLRSPKPCHARERDELYRKLTALSTRKAGIEVQLKSYKNRVNSLAEILQKIQKEEAELTSRLKSCTNLSSDNGGDKKQGIPPETVWRKGMEMVFRF